MGEVDPIKRPAGSNALAPHFNGVPLATDQRSLDRFIDWDEDLDARVDIGALELALTELCD